MAEDHITINSLGEPPKVEEWKPLTIAQRNYFLIGGLAFLGTALGLYILSGFMLLIIHPNLTLPIRGDTLTDRDIYNFYGRILSVSLAPALCIVSAIICTMVGIRLLRSSGVVATQVISPEDYPVLGPAISKGDEQAITQFIRLSSLSGVTGTFTKIGLTGLPLATIFLTIILAIMGLANSQFFDLAKLTLGAFLGSFVQRQSDVTARTS